MDSIEMGKVRDRFPAYCLMCGKSTEPIHRQNPFCETCRVTQLAHATAYVKEVYGFTATELIGIF